MNVEETEHSAAEPAESAPALAHRARRDTAARALGVAAGVMTVLMVIALFLPWATSGGTSESLAQYGAPRPAVIAWLLLALGVSGSVIASFSLFSGERRALFGLGAGGILYAMGAILWYGAAVWPTVIASGCASNGGPLCASSPSSPTIAGSTPNTGFLLGVAASLALIVLAPVAVRLWRTPAEPPTS